jgi:hypothetical protein
MDSRSAETVIESLRMGIPSEGSVTSLTVGRKSEIEKLNKYLINGGTQARLIDANYGCGKTHLLRYIEETAQKKGYITSFITLDSQSNARFNRMDQIFGQICRNIRVPGRDEVGIRSLFDSLYETHKKANIPNSSKDLMARISNNGNWDTTDELKSASMFIALRAWGFSYNNQHSLNQIDDLIEDWLMNPAGYQSQRTLLYETLVSGLRRFFYEPRPRWKFYNFEGGIFNFRYNDYDQSWNAINDLEHLSKAAGYKGLVVLVDEFEDVIYNLSNIKYQQDAFLNLFDIFFNKKFKGIAFFAVTPGFVNKCKALLQARGLIDYDYSRFDKLDKFKMSPLSTEDLINLSNKIIQLHEMAYGWATKPKVRESVKEICKNSSDMPLEHRTRQTIEDIVSRLDDAMGDRDD